MFSYIITYRYTSEIGASNLHAVLRYVRKHFKAAQIIVVEQDTRPRASRGVIREVGARYVFARSFEPFNYGWGLNIGAIRADKDILIFADHDFVVPEKSLSKALSVVSDGGFVVPFDKVVYVSENDSEKLWNEGSIVASASSKKEKAENIGGIVLTNRETFWEADMWKEGENFYFKLEDEPSKKTRFILGNGYCLHHIDNKNVQWSGEILSRDKGRVDVVSDGASKGVLLKHKQKRRKSV